MDKIIQYKNHTFIQYISNKKIDEKCKQIALEINKKYNNQSILIVGVLNGNKNTKRMNAPKNIPNKTPIIFKSNDKTSI